MNHSPARRLFVRKCLYLISTLPISGCGGGGGSSSSSITLPPADPAAVVPSIRTGPLDQTVMPGNIAVFQVVADGTPPLSYQWQRNGVSIPGATDATYSTAPATLGDNAAFSVIITNDAGSVTSRSAMLVVVPPAVQPSILAEPQDQTVAPGDIAVFEVLADGTPPLSYQWQRNGVSIPGANDVSHSTGPVALGDNAVFSVIISNGAGSVASRNAALVVAQAAITVDSTAYTVDSVSLTVDAT